jgi:hypothetical protein
MGRQKLNITTPEEAREYLLKVLLMGSEVVNNED